MEPTGKSVELEDDAKSSSMRPSHWRWILLLLIVAFIIGVAIFLHNSLEINWIEAYHVFPEKLRSMGVWGQLGVIILMIVHCFIPFPAEFLALAAGNVYGFVHGTVLVWIGAMVGASLSFALAKQLGKPFVTWILPEKHQDKLDKWTDDQGALTLLISRFIPLIAFNLINYAAGLTNVRWWTFLWTTGLGILPITAITVYMGHGMRELKTETLVIVSIFSILVMIVLHISLKKTRAS